MYMNSDLAHGQRSHSLRETKLRVLHYSHGIVSHTPCSGLLCCCKTKLVSIVCLITAAFTHTHTRLMALFPGLPGWAGTTCKSAPRSRQITMQHPTTQFFTGRMPFLPPNQQRQSTEGKTAAFTQSLKYSTNTVYWLFTPFSKDNNIMTDLANSECGN